MYLFKSQENPPKNLKSNGERMEEKALSVLLAGAQGSE